MKKGKLGVVKGLDPRLRGTRGAGGKESRNDPAPNDHSTYLVSAG
ncbi:MAG: hypothetical protein ACYSTG_10290 [Planctomycetota bacterium]